MFKGNRSFCVEGGNSTVKFWSWVNLKGYFLDTFLCYFQVQFFMVEVVYMQTVYLYFIGKIRVFFKVLSSQSFLKVNRCGSKGPIQWAFPASFSHNYNYVHISKTSYCSYFLAITVRFIKKAVPIRTFLN